MQNINNKKELIKSLKELIENRDINALRTFVEDNNSVDIAEVLNDFELINILFIFRSLKPSVTAEIFMELNDELRQQIIDCLTRDEIKLTVASIRTSDIVGMLETLPEHLVGKILDSCDTKTAKHLREFLKYPKESAGSYSHVKFVSLNTKDKIRDAIQKIKNEPELCHALNSYYVVDENEELVGVVNLKDIFFASRQESIKSIMQPNPMYVFANDDREVVSNMFQKYEIDEIPVVDEKKRLVGIISYDDVWEIMEEEVTEDFEKGAGITPIAEIADKNYLQIGAFSMAKSRLKWLVFLMVSATLSQTVLQIFANVYQSDSVLKNISFLHDTIFTAILVPILPVISGTAGNAGCQSSTVVLRALALGEITIKDYWKIVIKEYKTSVFVGIFLSFFNFLRMLAYYYILSIHNPPSPNHGFLGIDVDAWKSMISTTLALMVIVSIVKFVGASLPILAHKIKQDPAVMAAPLLTTLTDAISTAVFFSISMVVFHVLQRV